MEAVAQVLSNAERPVILAGGPGWSQQVRDDLTAFAEAWELPVAVMFRGQYSIDNRHPNYVGLAGIGIDPALGQRIKNADLILALGPRLGEITTSGYTLLTPPAQQQKLIHVYPGAEELNSVYRADVAIVSSLSAFTARLGDLQPPKSISWAEETRKARADYEAFSEPRETPGDVKMEQIISHVSKTLPEDGIITNGAGNYSSFIHRYTQYKAYRSQVATTSGTMGYGLPAAIAAKLATPDRKVVCYAGDGCFLMNGQELSTAVRYELPIVIIVVDNGMYGTIRMHQERDYPGRISGTELENPDFAAYARSFGAIGETIEKTEDFPAVFDAALNAEKPTLIHLKVDPQAITPTTTLEEIRAGAFS